MRRIEGIVIFLGWSPQNVLAHLAGFVGCCGDLFGGIQTSPGKARREQFSPQPFASRYELGCSGRASFFDQVQIPKGKRQGKYNFDAIQFRSA